MHSRCGSRVLATACFAAALCACGRNGSEADATTRKSVIVDATDVVQIERAVLRSGPKISGSLEAQERAAILAEANGSVLEVDVEIGDPVDVDQVLARIDPGGLDQSYRSARAAVEAAERALDVARQQEVRTEALVESGAKSQRDLEIDQSAEASAAAQVADARARAAGAAEQLRGTIVRSPLRGVLATRDVREGDVVTTGRQLFTVVELSSMRLEASVPSDYLAQLAVGKTVEFEVRGRPGRVFRGTISAVAPRADPATRQIAILVAIPNPTRELVTGLYAEGRIVAHQVEALALPITAVEQAGPRATVTALRGGKAVQVPVELGIRDEFSERIEVRHGLAAGERIVVGPARAIASGTKVDVRAAREARQVGGTGSR